jgi:hypothetical protein
MSAQTGQRLCALQSSKEMEMAMGWQDEIEREHLGSRSDAAPQT